MAGSDVSKTFLLKSHNVILKWCNLPVYSSAFFPEWNDSGGPLWRDLLSPEHLFSFHWWIPTLVGDPIFFNLLYFHFPLFTLLPPSPLQWKLNLVMYICILQLTQHQTLPIFHKNVGILSCTLLPFDLTTFLEKALCSEN